MNSRSPDLSQLRHWLLETDDALFLELARKEKRILSQLTALSYDPDLSVTSRAIKITGLAAKIIAERDPEYVRNYLLRLFWLVNDESGGVCWKAPELIGEILYHCPQFEQFFPMLISLLDLEKEDAPRFRTGTLWAIGRVAQVARKAMQPALPHVKKIASEEKDTNIMEMAQWCVKELAS
jgi:AraC family transcriptional regulator, regulatory protein of adaptative response / methylated-DNA-[protein]-cysteine methyltransferase